MAASSGTEIKPDGLHGSALYVRVALRIDKTLQLIRATNKNVPILFDL
jgi:hypothetical protein